MSKEEFCVIFGDINETYIKEARTFTKDKKFGWLKWGAMAACFGLILTTAMLTFPSILKGPGNVVPPSAPDPGPVISDDNESNSTDSIQSPETQNIIINWDKVFVNESAGTSLDSALLYRDPDIYAEETWEEKEIVAYYGWDLAPSYIPEDLSNGGQNVSAGIVREKATGEIVQEQAGRSFWTNFWEDGSPKSDDDIVIPTGFTVRASKLGILHCALLPVDESKTTDFEKVPVTIIHYSMPYGPFDPTQKAPNGLYNMPAGYYDIYVASFILDGVEYEIEAQRLELEEVIKIVASIINVSSSEDFIVGNN